MRWGAGSLLAIIALVATACGGADPTPGSAEAPDAPVSSNQDVDAESESGSAPDGGEEAALCEVFSEEEIIEVFDGQIELAERRGVGASSCAWTVVGAEGEGLIISTIPRGWVDQRIAAFEDNDNAEVERPDLGEDAILIQGSDLGIKVDGDTEYRVGMTAIFLGEDMGGDGTEAPDPMVVREAVLHLGELLLDRVG